MLKRQTLSKNHFLNERTANYNFDLNRLLALFYIHFKSQLGSFSKLDSYENRNYDFSQEIRFFFVFNKIQTMKDVGKKPEN